MTQSDVQYFYINAMDQPRLIALAAQVKDGRLKKNYTQQQLADLTGISLRSIQRIENAEVAPRDYTLKLIEQKLDISLLSEIVKPPDSITPKTNHPLNRSQKIILTITVFPVLALLAAAYVFQSATFPETQFELALYSMAIIILYTIILLCIWR